MHYLTDIDVSSYSSNSQKIRILSEAWLSKNGFCPSCGGTLLAAKNNSKACDFICYNCSEQFELKCKSGKIGTKIVDGAYDSLVSRVESATNPNLCLLQYSKIDFSIENFMVVPRYFFTKFIIEKRKPLALTARRAGWVGCNIAVSQIPEVGKIHFIINKKELSKELILKSWRTTSFLRDTITDESRGWLLDTIKCIEKIGTNSFSLDMIYKFESELKEKYPDNYHIKEKLRQQLQILRDRGYIIFTTRGNYRIATKQDLNPDS